MSGKKETTKKKTNNQGTEEENIPFPLILTFFLTILCLHYSWVLSEYYFIELMIKHFPFVFTKGLATPLLLSALSVSIWQMPNLHQSKHSADSLRWISQMLEFNQEHFGLMSLPHYVSHTHYHRIFFPSSSKQ